MSRHLTHRPNDSMSVKDAIAWTAPRAGFWSVSVAARRRQRVLRRTRGGGR